MKLHRIKPAVPEQIPAIFALSALLLAIVACSGCHLRPDLGPPGTIGAQRTRFVLNDPYPSNYLGPPITGGRPRGFDLPLSEAQNHQVAPASELNKSNRGFFERLRNGF